MPKGMPPLPIATKGAFPASMPKFPPIPTQAVKSEETDSNSGKVHGLKNATDRSMQVCEKTSAPDPSIKGSFAQVAVGLNVLRTEEKTGALNITSVMAGSMTTT